MLDIKSDFYDKIKIITPKDEYFYFFGYYDLYPTESGSPRHLAHRSTFMDRFPKADDKCELGYLVDGKFTKFAETFAWNFQQGAMLTYHPTKRSTVLYNTVKDGNFVTAIHNIDTGEISYAERPSATYAPNGKFSLSVNFARIFEFRAGYGYAGAVDKNVDVCVPDDDGVFYVDLETGKSRLLLSYRDILKESGFKDDEKVLINHITVCPDSNKFLMLVRAKWKNGQGWDSTMMVGDLSGNFKTLIHRTYFSHYYWLSPDEIVAHTSLDGDKTRALYIIDAHTGATKAVDSFFFATNNSDIHCSLSPDGKYIIGDGYPDEEEYRHFLSIDRETGKSKVILKAKSIAPEFADLRCDLHARFAFDGKYVSFDTTADNNRREIAVFPVEYLDCN